MAQLTPGMTSHWVTVREIAKQTGLDERKIRRVLRNKFGGAKGTSYRWKFDDPRLAQILVALDTKLSLSPLPEKIEIPVQLHRPVSADQILVPTVIPLIDLSRLTGILAWREWLLASRDLQTAFFTPGRLHSTATRFSWDSRIMIADTPPTETNHNGLYAHLLNAEYVGASNRISSYGISGLVDCRGKVLIHADGWVRAEAAEIICVLITGEVFGYTRSIAAEKIHTQLKSLVNHLREQNIPYYIVTPAVRSRIIWQAINYCERRKQEYGY